MRSPGDHSSDHARLHLGPSFEAAWENVILPWFKGVSLTGSSTERPTLVVVPYQSRAQFIRCLLVEARLPLLGVEFVTPAQLRELLLRSTSVKLPLREHLRLLLAIAAEQLRQTADTGAAMEPLNAARAVLREPDHLLRTIDELNAAGWAFEETGPRAFRGVVAGFDALVRQAGFTLVQIADRLALERAEAAPPIFENLLIAGFDGAHWPSWPLLCATAKSAAQATVILADPREEARDLDECWIGSWEQLFGPASQIAPAARTLPSATGSPKTAARVTTPQLELFDDRPAPAAEVHFLLGQETTEEARAVVTLILKFLADPACHRVGVLFPAPGALARSVAHLLNKHGLPHFDAVGHLIAPTLEDVSWLAWLDLQENNRLRPFLHFLSTLENKAVLLGGMTVKQIANVLGRACSQILIDDIAVLREFCHDDSELPDAAAVANCLGGIEFLPAVASLRVFTDQIRRIFDQLGWKDRRTELERLTRDWIGSIRLPLSRAIYLRWLGEILGKPTRSRDPMGDHPYSRIQLLTLPEAEGQHWSHLILAGLNEGAWPPAHDESDFVRDEEIEALNRRIKNLNRSATIRGRQGEGQWSVAPGRALCLGAHERRQLALRQTANLVESAGAALAMTASLFTESVPRRLANPSELFTRSYFQHHGSGLSQTTLEALQAETEKWMDALAWPATSVAPEKATIQATRRAYDARRAEVKAGEFEFALRAPPSEPISLSASEFERFFKAPALIWMKALLGVQSDEQDMEQWSLALGNWVHQWLRQIVPTASADTFGRLGPDLAPSVHQAAAKFRDQIATLLKEREGGLPDWWISTWSHAFYLADLFAGQVAQVEGWPYAATEWSLRGLPAVSVGQGATLRLRGRMDLVLSKNAAALNDLNGTDLWVIDYKTGKRDSLRSSRWRSEDEVRQGVLKKLLKGEGIQVALYSLALRQLGGGHIGMSLLARGLNLTNPQLQLSEVSGHHQFWRELVNIQKSGVFGARGAIRSEFSFSGDYPLATLPVDPDLLEKKWTLTHPGFAGDAAEEDA